MPGTINVTTDEGTGVKVVQIQLPGSPGPQGNPGAPGAPGPSTVLTIGSVTTGAAGSAARATLSGVSPNQVLNLTIPQGIQGVKGDPNTLTIGTVTTVDAVTGGSATITGTSPNQVLNLVMPRGYGVIPAGATNTVLVKASATDYDTAWETPTGTGSLVRKSYADTGDSNTLTSANSHADTGDAATLSSANSHADTGDTNTLASAKSYTDTTDGNRKTYVDTQDAATLNSAKSYADTQDTTKLASAKSYADTQDATTLASAKSYSDSQDVTNLASAKTYTDTQFTTPPASRKLAAVLGSGTAFPASGMLLGDNYFRTDLGTNGSLWTYIGGAAGSSGWVHKGVLVCTSTTRPAVTYSGMQIHETDTANEYYYSGGWVRVMIGYRMITGQSSQAITSGSNSQWTPTINFGYTFTSAPTMVATPTGSSTDYNWVLWPQATTTGFTCLLKIPGTGGSPTTGNVNFSWVAVGN